MEHRFLIQSAVKFRYDLIFDGVGPQTYSFELMSSLLNPSGTFVTIVTPVFRDVDKYGLISGLSRSTYKAVRQTLYVGNLKEHTESIAYGFF